MHTIEIGKLRIVVPMNVVPSFCVLKVMLPSRPCVEGDHRNFECRANEPIRWLTDKDDPTSPDMYDVSVIA